VAIVISAVTGVALYESGYLANAGTIQATTASRASINSTSLLTPTMGIERGNGTISSGSVYIGGSYWPSGVFIPANTLTWATFLYPLNITSDLTVTLNVWGYPAESHASMRLGVYAANGSLWTETFGDLGNVGYIIGADNQMPNGTANQLDVAMQNARGENFTVSINPLTVPQKSPFTVAFVSNESLWVMGGLSSSTQPSWMVPATYEASAGQYTLLPASLPHPSYESPVVLAVSGFLTYTVDWNS
jgi:hypothetical protein